MKGLLKIIRRILTLYHTFIAHLTCRNFNAQLKANGRTILTQKTSLGNNVHFNGMRIYGNGKVIFGSNFHSGKNCKIITDIHNYHGSKIPYDETYIIKDVVIEDNVWLGMDVIILGGVTIGEGAIIQAGSVVVKNIEKLAIAGGHPAIVFSQRDKTHYNNLVAAKSFL
jgi:acetyltransferase-like isoleucine patch superfamily enzyme